MSIIYETRYYEPTDNHGARIKVTNTLSGLSRWHYWDYAVNWGLDQHEHAVWQSAAGTVRTVTHGGNTKRGYLFTVEIEEEEN